MADGSDQTGTESPTVYGEGDILLWRIKEASASLAEKATADMGALAEAFNLGWDWGCGPIGLGEGLAWFDLVLERPIDAVLVKLIFGMEPEIY